MDFGLSRRKQMSNLMFKLLKRLYPKDYLLQIISDKNRNIKDLLDTIEEQADDILILKREIKYYKGCLFDAPKKAEVSE